MRRTFLVIALLLYSDVQAHSITGNVLPACHVPPAADTTGWQTVRLGASGHYLLCQVPPGFRRDANGPSWRDGSRRLVTGAKYICLPGSRTPECHECVDTLAGFPMAITTSHDTVDSLYHIALTPIDTRPDRRGDAERGLHFSTPDRGDQSLLLAALRTMREESWVVPHGTLVMGGNILEPPYVLTRAGERLTINGYQLPDLVPPSTRPPATHAELEARRTIEARLIALRDSLKAHGMERPHVQERLRDAALRSALVRSVGLIGPDSTRGLLTLDWRSGYRTVLGTAPVHMDAREEEERLWLDRMEHLRTVLDSGRVLFLLGGGCEYSVDRDHADAAREDAQGIIARSHSRSKTGLLPADVVAQLRAPLTLERAP